MTRKKKKETSTAGLYAMCITVGVIVGLGLTPLMGNLLAMVIAGGVAGAGAAYLINKNAPKPSHRKHH
ncbi:MAG: hypothetical protein KJN90_14040 [Gammaproteobacteria bacterium]|nr:hypothetical protein [Gammaproteobacteria bacterium]